MEWIYVMIMGALVVVILVLVVRALSTNRARKSDSEYEVESEITSFINEFKHIANLKIDILTEKEEELREVIKEANSMIVRLNATVADAQRISETLQTYVKNVKPDQRKIEEVEAVKNYEIGKKPEEDVKVRMRESVIPSSEQEKVNPGGDYDLLKRRVAELANDNWKISDIARMLGIGVREARLMLNLTLAKQGYQVTTFHHKDADQGETL